MAETHSDKLSLIPARQNTAHSAQLSELLPALRPMAVSTVLSSAIHGGSLNTVMASTVLANDGSLEGILRGTCAYRFDTSLNPAKDFSLLSSGNCSQAADGLRRLTQAFLEARSSLSLGIEQGELPKHDPAVLAFQKVNASYILLIATVHTLIDNPDPAYKKEFSPLFKQLLINDPYLGKLAPYFSSLHDARSPEAKKVSLRHFFETFCSEAVQPTLYNEGFSAVVQSILIRELRHVIDDEAKLPAGDRKMAPYLASLFEARMRGELQTARRGDGKPQPVLQALRRCPGEAKILLQAISNFLIESCDGDQTKLAIDDKVAVSCEVMLSVGCLLPETKTVDHIGELFERVTDLHPTLALIFSSALKFSLYSENPTAIDAEFLVQRGLEAAPVLSEGQRIRLIAEVLKPLTEAFIDVAGTNPQLWLGMPAEFRTECIDQVIAQKIVHPESRSAAEPGRILDSGTDSLVAQLLLGHLASGTEGTATVSDVCARWLALQTDSLDFDSTQATLVTRLVVNRPGGHATLGITDSQLQVLLQHGGHPTIELLAGVPEYRAFLASRIGEYSATGSSEKNSIQEIFSRIFIAPLRETIDHRAELIDKRRESDSDQLSASDKVSELEHTRAVFQRLENQLPVLQSALENDLQFLRVQQDFYSNQHELSSAEAIVTELSRLSTKQLFDQKKIGPLRSAQEQVKSCGKTGAQLRQSAFRLSRETLAQLGAARKSSITLGEFLDLQVEHRDAQEKIARIEGGARDADTTLSDTDRQLLECNRSIAVQLRLVRDAMRSPALRGIDLDTLNLQSRGKTDLLGIICRTQLTLEMMTEPKSAKSRGMIQFLESSIQSALKDAFRDSESKQDSIVALTELAKLVKYRIPLMHEWPESASLEESGASFSVQALTGNVSLAEFLYQTLKKDLSNPESAWLSHDNGWDESLHGPVLVLFGELMTSKASSDLVKKRSMLPIFRGVTSWLDQEQQTREREKANLSLPPEEAKRISTRKVEFEPLLASWTSLLQTSRGITSSKITAEGIRKNTSFLGVWGAENVATATAEQLATLYFPFARAVLRCAKSEHSALRSSTPEIDVFLKAVSARDQFFREMVQKNTQTVIASAPQAVSGNGLDFASLRTREGLALPAPSYPSSASAGNLGYRKVDETEQ